MRRAGAALDMAVNDPVPMPRRRWRPWLAARLVLTLAAATALAFVPPSTGSRAAADLPFSTVPWLRPPRPARAGDARFHSPAGRSPAALTDFQPVLAFTVSLRNPAPRLTDGA